MGGRVELARGIDAAAGCMVMEPEEDEGGRRRKGCEAEQKIRETRAGVTVTTVFPGAILKPEGPPTMPPPPGPALVVQDVYCIFCHGTNVKVSWKDANQRSYQCFSCVDPDTGTWTTFKLQRRRPPLKSASGGPEPSSARPSSSRGPAPGPPRSRG